MKSHCPNFETSLQPRPIAKCLGFLFLSTISYKVAGDERSVTIGN